MTGSTLCINTDTTFTRIIAFLAYPTIIKMSFRTYITALEIIKMNFLFLYVFRHNILILK